MKQNPAEVSRIVAQANQCQNEEWQWWTFTAESRKLVLCGYQAQFNVTGYLVFYNPRQICIPHYINNAVIGCGVGAVARRVTFSQENNTPSKLRPSHHSL